MIACHERRIKMKKIYPILMFLLITSPLWAKRTELSFWFSSGFNAKECIETMVDEYNRVQSEVYINAGFQGLYEEMEVKIVAAAVTRQLPDIAQEKFEYLDLYIDEGLLEPIDSELSRSDREDIFGSLWEAVTRDGKVYGVPFCVNTYIFFYNEDLLDVEGTGPPSFLTTWEGTINEGKRLTADTNGDGITDRYAMIFWQNGFEICAPFLWALGGKLFREDGSGVDLSSEEMYQAVSFIRDLVYVHGIMPHNWTNFEGGQAFLSGDLAMGPFISGGLVYFEDNLPWNLRITSFPFFRGEKHLPLTGSALVNFSRNKKRRRAAHEFIMWLVNRENTIQMYKDVGYLPVRRSAVQSLDMKAFIKEHPNHRYPIEALAFSRPLPNHREFYKINQMILKMVERIMLTDADIRDELERTEKAINAAIEP
jgi:ABC-type glycerol-3-phosphate transport system substrate-binding protein